MTFPGSDAVDLLASAPKTFVAPKLIAEIGTGHLGDMARARELIFAAAEAGAAIVKFQYVVAREILHPNTGSVPLPGGPTPLYEVFKGLERPPEFYAELKLVCSEAGVEFLCTPFGLGSAAALENIGVDRFKVASPELNHHPLLEFLSATGRPLILSTGVSTLADIDESVRLLRSLDIDSQVTLLHCITSYPAPEEEYNIALVATLRNVFGLATGVSDHSMDPILVPTLTGLLGGTLVEKHLGLSRTSTGLDDPIALDPQGMTVLYRQLAAYQGSSTLDVLEDLNDRYGADRIRAILGTGVKDLAPSEAPNYGRTNRSIHVLEDLPAGSKITKENTAILRTEKILRPGLHPRHWTEVLGVRTTRNIEAGQGLVWEDILS